MVRLLAAPCPVCGATESRLSAGRYCSRGCRSSHRSLSAPKLTAPTTRVAGIAWPERDARTAYWRDGHTAYCDCSNCKGWPDSIKGSFGI
ncbi:MAG: hypothetical protein UY64_C0008G0008 [Parcubacteria group bacterium GW2011_GWA1_51_12]|nr:MAG: hypothetical protein UY64_C0008G0008 [Parcubacteria group bacterium GW2011_GWA1_51_12]